jgi:hypothetical protein
LASIFLRRPSLLLLLNVSNVTGVNPMLSSVSFVFV